MWYDSSRFKMLEIEFEQKLERQSSKTSPVDASDGFEHPKMPQPLPRCPQCGAAYAPGAKRCKRCKASLNCK